MAKSFAGTMYNLQGHQGVSQSAQYLIDALCPSVEITRSESFCGYVDGALIFRINSPGPASRK